MTDAADLARRAAAAMYERDVAAQSLGMIIDEVRPGYARLRMRVRSEMLNGHDVCHGGLIFALADTAFAYACNSRNVRTVAAQASIVFLDQAREGEVLVAEAEERTLVGRSGVTHVSVRTADGRPLAEFTGFSRSLGGAVIGDSE